MNKLYAARLLSTAMIDAKPRSPAEGIQMVTEADRDRLIAAKQAEDAEGDVEREGTDDGLEAKGMTERKLRDLAKKEGAAVEGDADKPTIVSAIRDRRALFAGTGIDPVTDDDLRKIAGDESVDLTDAADTAAIVTAISAARASA